MTMKVEDLWVGRYKTVVFLLRGGIKERINNAIVYEKGGTKYLKHRHKSFSPNTTVIRAKTKTRRLA